MKNLILCAALLAGIFIVSCAGEDDSVPIPVYIGCAICEIPETGPSEIEELPYEVCVDADGVAYVDNANTGVQADYYFSLYCSNDLELPVPPLPPSEFDDDAVGTCRTCDAYDIMGEEQPAEEVCKGENGNAFVLGADTGTPYAQYLTVNELVTDCQ